MNRYHPATVALPPHALTPVEVARSLSSDSELGLTGGEAAARLARHGANRPQRPDRPAYITIALRQFADPLVALLVAAAGVSAAIGEGVEAAAVGAIVVLNGILGFVQEVGAERAVLALRETLERRASVVRDRVEREVPVEEVVPGDLVVLREGERVPADGRLVAAESLAVDESILTGESLPVDKMPEPVSAETTLAERSPMVFAGTGVTRGRARALVTATGDATEVGRVAHLASEAKPPPTPLQRRLGRLARVMVVLGGLITLALAGAMLLRGSSPEEAFLVGVSVAVAAVPEGLAATVTIALALGATRMAARGAIVRRLTAVETLGSATVVASDKTGTLTENRLRVAAAAPAPGRNEKELLAAGVLASTAELLELDGSVRVAGDPVEGALLIAAHEQGVSPSGLRAERKLIREIPFDPTRKRMTMTYEENGALRAFVKGAPEVVLARSLGAPDEHRRLRALAERWAAEGLRVLAVADRTLTHEALGEDDVERDLCPMGLVALHDPLRPEAVDAVREARAAGLGVRILTGDHPITAGAIGRELALPPSAVHARVTPAEKLRLVEDLQERGEVVAVTGDGVNDAPALRRADVGVAMGKSGTETAREAADLVLTDDNFATILAAIHEGRAIADNLRKFVAFLLSANLGEVVLFAIAVLAGLGPPMTVVQILAVNVLTDGLPAVALARDPASPGTMRRPPERGDQLFPRPVWAFLALVGGMVGIAALGAFLVGRALGDDDVARTMAFATVALAELGLVFTMRSYVAPAWKAPRNLYLVGAVAASAGVVALVLYVPALHDPFSTVGLGASELGIVAALGLAPFVVVETLKRFLRHRGR